jgi:hypothetical protein
MFDEGIELPIPTKGPISFENHSIKAAEGTIEDVKRSTKRFMAFCSI